MNLIVPSPDGQLLACSETNGVVCVWDVSSRTRHEFRVHTDRLVSIALSPDGRFLACASMDGGLRLFNWREARPLVTFVGHNKGTLRRVVFSPNGCTLAASSADGTITLWDIATGRSFDL